MVSSLESESADVGCRPEGVEVGVVVISVLRCLQEDFSEHGEIDRDDLLRVVVTLSECCSDLLLVHQTWQGRLKHQIHIVRLLHHTTKSQLSMHMYQTSGLTEPKFIR